ncbi:MAG: GNAT family N-acetyltransferase [Bacteroidetes bacterium]|nr:GNAT family N-acetyltransferase [Bacteroidota bacterium]
MKNNTFSFKMATLNDIDQLAKMRVEFLSELMGPQPNDKAMALHNSLVEYFKKEIQSGDYISWLAYEGIELIANGGMKVMQRPGSFRVPDGRSGYIMSMYTKPNFRKMGIGQTILSKLIETGKARGLTFFELHATKDGEPLYKQNGFNFHPEPSYRLFI